MRAAAGTRSWRTLESLKPGEVLSGKVKAVEAYGVFVDIAGSALTGLAHRSELVDGVAAAEPAKHFFIGQACPLDSEYTMTHPW
jgi:ribosomal protein S1